MSGAGSTRRRTDGMPPEDWDLLFCAVACQLRLGAQGAPALPQRALVEDCVHSLELLHAALAQERGYLRRIENQLHETCVALAAARAELAAVALGESHALRPPPERAYAGGQAEA